MSPAFFTGAKQCSVSPYINHFLQPDTIVQSYTNPKGLNRYSYVLNNPVKLFDPTGHRCADRDANNNTINVDCDTGTTTGLSAPSLDGKIIHHHNNSGKDDHKLEKIIQNYVDHCIKDPNSSRCQVHTDPSINAWPPSGYYIDYHFNIDWSTTDWTDLFFSGAGVIGDGLTIATVFFGFDPLTVEFAGVTFPLAVPFEVINKVGVGYDLYKLAKYNDPSGSTIDLLGTIFEDSKMWPGVSLLANGSGFLNALPDVTWQPVLKPIPPTILTAP